MPLLRADAPMLVARNPIKSVAGYPEDEQLYAALEAIPGRESFEAGTLTRVFRLVGIPCQEWDIDPDTPGTGLPPGADLEGAQLPTHRIPAMERATVARGYRAFEGHSADRHAILGPVDGIDGLYLATGSSGSGFKVAPAVGLCMAELITEGRARTVDVTPSGLWRFAAGKSVEGPYAYAPRRDYWEPVRGTVV